MSHDDAVKFFAAQQEEWTARDAGALALRHAETGTIVSPIFRTVEGRQEILESYQALFATFPDWDFRATRLIVDGDRVAQEFTVHATHTREFMGLAGSGRTFDIEGVLIFEIEDGLIRFERRYYDFTGLLIQLGILRGKPARPDTPPA
ncbi:MAG: ester cyclase [Acidobacteriota bacterium]